MWFPGQRMSNSRAWDLFWDLWFFSPRHMLGTSGYGPQFRTPFAPARWDGGRTATSGDPRPDQGRDGWRPPGEAGKRDLTVPLVHPVRIAPVVTASATGEDGETSGQETAQKPSIDPVMPTRPVETLFEPTSIQRIRQKSLTRPEIDRRAPARKEIRLRSGSDMSRPSSGLQSDSRRVFESTNSRVFKNRVTTGSDRPPSARSRPGATRPVSTSVRSAQPRSSASSRSASTKKPAPKQ